MAFKLKGLQEQRAKVDKDQKALWQKAEAEKRELTGSERLEERRLDDEFNRLSKEISEVQAVDARNAADALAMFNGRTGSGGDGIAFRDMRTGKEYRALRPADSFARAVAPDMGTEPIRPGECLRAMLLGRTETLSDAERRAITGATDTSGGYLLSPTLSGMFADLARANMVCVKAGAQTLPMDSGEVHLARLASDPTAHWRPEGVSVSASSPTFDQIIMRPRTVAAIVPVSLEWIQDAANAGRVVQDAMSSAIALAVDKAALIGEGAASEPLGVRNHASVNTVAVGAGVGASYDKVRDALYAIFAANYQGEPSGLSWIQHPRTAADYDSVRDGEGNAISMSPWLAGLKRYMTSSLPITEGVGGADGVDVLGDFTQMLIGIRQQVQIRVLDGGSVADSAGVTWNAASQLLRLVVAYARVDVALMRPTWFSIITGYQS